MAGESSSNGSSSGSSSSSWSSPITQMGQDQLYLILLLLPADSILSLATTCKRFRSLAYSDSLWESICRREWGHSSVDALLNKSSSPSHFNVDVDAKQQQQQPIIPWKKVYQQVHLLDSVSCHRLLLSDHPHEEEFPRPRASHSLNFVADYLVLFGGGCEGGRHLDDTWVAYIGNDVRRTVKWQKINSGIPSGRFGHLCVVIGDALVLFGGINDHGIRQNDTWIGQVTSHETFGITLSWKLLDVGPIAPPPRGAHAGCCIDNKHMLIHGGIGLYGLRLGDTWVLDFSENHCFGIWREIVTHPSPLARSGHTVTYIGGSQMVLFGGRGSRYEVLNDVWLFDTSEGHLHWVQLQFELQNMPEGLSLPRVGHSATLILGGRLLIYGGEDSCRRRKDDFWILDIRSRQSIKMQPMTVNSQELLANMWRRPKSKGYKPNCRSFHQACADPSGRYLYMFGGMVDGLIQPAELSGLGFDGELFLVELVIQF